MHSRIYQVSKNPINADDFISADQIIEENYWMSFADYIDDNLEEQLDTEYENFPFLAAWLKMFFTENDFLVFVSADEVQKLWKEKIDDAKERFDHNGIISVSRYRLKEALEQPFTEARFWIEDWSSYPDTSADFIEFCASKLKPGDKLYLGNVLDFHY